MIIHLNPVQSSMISAIGYDPDSETLAVKFVATGDTYHYSHVSEDDYAALCSADSVGKYFNAHIKGKRPGNKL